MILRSYELQSAEEADEEAVLDPAINERLGDVRCPTLVIVGDEDIADMQGIAAHVAASIGDARLETVTGASHLPSLERPDEVNPFLLEFLRALGARPESACTSGCSSRPRRLTPTSAASMFAEVGAVVLGRRTFEVGRPQWEDTPYPGPVLRAHPPRPPADRRAEQHLHFRRRRRGERRRPGPSDRPREGDRDGAETSHVLLAAGLVDAIQINLVPVLLGDGVRLFDNLPAPDLSRGDFSGRDSTNATHRRDSGCVSPGASMKPNRSIPSAAVVPVLVYPDVREAVAWLETAFGFAERVRIGESHRSQLSVGEGGAVIVADVRQRPAAAARRRGDAPGDGAGRRRGRPLRARAAHGATILMEPTDFEYGERQYQAQDPAGHLWTFSRPSTTSRPRRGAGRSSRPRSSRSSARRRCR